MRHLSPSATWSARIGPRQPMHSMWLHGSHTQVLSRLPAYRRAHFACHALEDPDDASHSGLVLTPPGPEDRNQLEHTDDILQTSEIEHLTLSCEIVVLSACSTAAGDLQRGEGLVGLAHAFHVGGARQVLAALWPVDDTTTARFMTFVYEQLEDGQPLDRAVRHARSELAAERPAHWAPWVVFRPQQRRAARQRLKALGATRLRRLLTVRANPPCLSPRQ